MSYPAVYRKRPVLVHAAHFDGSASDASRIINWVLTGGGAAHYRPPAPPLAPVGWLVIETLEGDMKASPGDWIIQGVQGEFYPCKPAIFAVTYEAVR